MKKLITPAILTTAALVTLTACASYDGASPADFAKASCGQMEKVYTAEEATITAISGAGDATEATRTTITTSTQEILTALETAKAEVAKVKPAVKDGENIVGYFNTYFDARSKAIQDALTAFEGASQTEDFTEFLNANIALGDAIMSEGDLTFPYAEITDQKIVGAVDDESACDQIVQVY